MEYSANSEGNISKDAEIGQIKFNPKEQKQVEETGINIVQQPHQCHTQGCGCFALI